MILNHKSGNLAANKNNESFGQESRVVCFRFGFGLLLCALVFGGVYFFGGGFTENTREYYIGLLKKTAEKEGRLPKKSDFSQDDVNRIKGIFGPWPWALEAAQLKESKKEERQEKNRLKHQRSRENRKQFKESGEDKNGTD